MSKFEEILQNKKDKTYETKDRTVFNSFKYRGSLSTRPPSQKFPKIQGFQGGFLGFQALFKVFR